MSKSLRQILLLLIQVLIQVVGHVVALMMVVMVDKSKSRIIIWGIVAATVIVAVVSFTYLKPSQAPNAQTEINKLNAGLKPVLSGNYAGSNAALKELTSSDVPFVAFSAKAQMGTNYYYQLDPENQKNGIEVEKQLINDPSNQPAWRAFAVDRIIDFYNDGSFTSAVGKEILSSPPFSAITATKRADVLKALAEYSNNLYPHSYATEVIAAWYRGQLLNNATLDSKTRASYINTLVTLLTQSEAQFNQQRGTLFSSKVLDVLYYDAHGLNQAGLALMKKDDPEFDKTAFEKTFQEGLTVLNNAPFAGGLVAQQFSSFINFFYAQYLAEIYGKARSADIQAHLKKVMALSQANPKNTFNLFVEQKRNEPAKEKDFVYRSFLKLASLSPDFNSYLKVSNWPIK